MPDITVQAKAQSVNMVTKFESDLHNLLAVLGQSDVQVLAPGTAFNVYKTSGTLSTDAVAEKAEIPDSGITAALDHTVEVTYGKYRNLTGIETIGKLGYDVAVGMTGDKMLREIEAKTRQTLFTAIATGTGTGTAGATFQAATANCWAAVDAAMEDEAGDMLFFVNPTDAASYLGTANVGLATAWGMSYIQNFLGLGTVIVDSKVTAGTIYGTVKQNLTVVAADTGAIPGMELVRDQTGIIGVHTDAAYRNAAIETVAYTGLAVEPAFLDRIVKVTIGA